MRKLCSMVLEVPRSSPKKGTTAPCWAPLSLIVTRILSLLKTIEIDQRTDKKFGQGFIEALAQLQERKQVTGSVTLSQSQTGDSQFLIWSEGSGVPRGRAGGVAQVVCPPLCGVECRWACIVLSFCSWLFRSRSWALCLCIFLVKNLPQPHMCSYFCPIQFLCIFYLQERCVQVPDF